jgi:hypothetical protein
MILVNYVNYNFSLKLFIVPTLWIEAPVIRRFKKSLKRYSFHFKI